MGQVSPYLRRLTNGYAHWCPACGQVHVFGDGWTFDGNLERPTFSPSMLIRSGHYAPHYKQDDNCWCIYNSVQLSQGLEPAPFKCSICHYYLRDGQLQFLSDCAHALSGQTVPLPALPDFLTDAAL